MAQLETLEAKMASIEVSLSSSSSAIRRRKGTSLNGCGGLNGSVTSRSSLRPDLLHSTNGICGGTPSSMLTINSSSSTKELRSALQDREEIMQNLRVKLGLGKLPRPSGTPLDESERPVAEQRLNRLRIDGDNKRIAIRNLKAALEKLDISDNIDVRIRQAELEYALGREELQLLSLVEELRALQARIDKSKPESNTLFSVIQSGVNLTLQAVQATVGRWAANTKSDSPGLWIEWALDGEGLNRGDRIIEINGKLCTCKTREELQKLIGSNTNNNNNIKCQMVVIRKRSTPFQQQQLVQFQEDNQRLQHRISYLEDQVKELQTYTSKDIDNPHIPMNNANHLNGKNNGSHITSICISAPSAPSTPPMENKPQIFQRGNFITTIVDGKPVDPPPSTNALKHNGVGTNNNVTKTIIKENGFNNNHNQYNYSHQQQTQHHNHNNNKYHHHRHHLDSDLNLLIQQQKMLSASKLSINSDIGYMKCDRDRNHHNSNHHHQKQMNGNSSSNGVDNQIEYKNRSNASSNIHDSYSRSVEYLNHTNLVNGYTKEKPKNKSIDATKCSNRLFSAAQDVHSVNSLDCDSDTNRCTSPPQKGGDQNRRREIDYTSEPVVTSNRIRPQPPKKPLRLSLQRAQSLQTVEPLIAHNINNSNNCHTNVINSNNLLINTILENEKKRAIKRAHKSSKTPAEFLQQQFIENNIPIQTSSLGRNKCI